MLVQLKPVLGKWLLVTSIVTIGTSVLIYFGPSSEKVVQLMVVTIAAIASRFVAIPQILALIHHALAVGGMVGIGHPENPQEDGPKRFRKWTLVGACIVLGVIIYGGLAK